MNNVTLAASTPTLSVSTPGEPSIAELTARSRRQIDESIRMMPVDGREAYLEAMREAPFLFEDESDPWKFMQRSDYNTWEASKRLCLYWKERKALFGSERAFLPLTMTGDGALNTEDVLAVRGGYPAPLPDNRAGEKVMYSDRRQFVRSVSVENYLRAFYYWNHVLAADEKSRTEGFLALLLVDTHRLQDIDFIFFKKVCYFALSVMPVRLKRIHLMSIRPTKESGVTSRLYKVQQYISFCVENMVQAGLDFADIDIHLEHEPGEFLSFLTNELGMSPEGIPQTLGGSWNFNDFTAWCRNRCLLERQKYKPVLQAVKRARGSQPKELSEAEKLARGRAVNLVHSRRKRERRQQEMRSLFAERKELEKEQAVLLAEQKRLLDLLNDAKQLMSSWNDADGISPIGTVKSEVMSAKMMDHQNLGDFGI